MNDEELDCGRGRFGRSLAVFATLAALIAWDAGCATSARAPRDGQPDPERIDTELIARRIAPDVHVITHLPFYASNVLVVRMADGTLVICSSPFDTQATRVMLRWLRQRFAPARIVAINTHFHPDGAAGNEGYHEGGVETYATELTQALLVERGAQNRALSAANMKDPVLRARIENIPMVPARTTFRAREGLTLTFGADTVRVIYPGPAHSPDNVVVHFPTQGVLFGGCMIKSARTIGHIGDADLGHWEAAVRSVAGLGARLVVPGHGRVGGPELLDHTIEVVRAARLAEGMAEPRH